MAKIGLDWGHHFDTPGKRTPPLPNTNRVIREWEFNYPTVWKLKRELERLGHEIVLMADAASDTPLAVRVKRANDAKVDLVISIHYNALNGEWGSHGGIETWYNVGSLKGKELADKVQVALINKTKLRNRGIKAGTFYIIKNTKAPAILIEAGFMDNLTEASLMLDVNYQSDVSTAITEAIQGYLGIKTIDTVPTYPNVSEWACSSWEWAVENGITDGTDPKGLVTKEQVIKLIYEARK